MTAGVYEIPPAPAKQWPARAAAWVALSQTAVLMVSAGCAWWEERSAAQVVAAAVARHPQFADHAAEATAIVASTYQDMVMYSVAMAPLFLGCGIWLLRGRRLPSRVVTLSIAAMASVCCVGAACFTDYTTQSETTDALMRYAPSGSVLDNLLTYGADSRLLTPVASVFMVTLLAVQIYWDRTTEAGMTVYLGGNGPSMTE